MRTVRNYLVLGCAAVSLAACGGDTRPEAVGNVPPVGTPGNGTATPTPGTGGSGGGVGGGTGGGTPTPAPANFLDITTATTFDAVGGFQSLSQTTTAAGTSELYTANASTVQTPSGTVNYSPRDGVFTLTIADPTAGVERNLRFQDPAHRASYTDDQLRALQLPNFTNFNYLTVLNDDTLATLFYQRPGTATTYVSLGGFSRVASNPAAGTFNAERGVFVFGQETASGQVPVTGSGSYSGGFIASMVNDTGANGRSALQWINGSSNVRINFATGKVDLAFNGAVGEAFNQNSAANPNNLAVAPGSIFTALGTAQIDLIRSGGFAGAFTLNAPGQNNVGFMNNGVWTGIDFASVASGGSTAGASSIDGGFYGPGGVNVGGNFRIIGGIPNQRIDVLGAFTGAKQ